MPTILTVGPCRFFFYSADGAEAPHVHVERERSSAKFWIHPVVLTRSHGFARSELLDEDISVEGIVAGRRSMESAESFRRWLEDRREPGVVEQ